MLAHGKQIKDKIIEMIKNWSKWKLIRVICVLLFLPILIDIFNERFSKIDKLLNLMLKKRWIP